MTDKQNAIQKGLSAAQEAARAEGMTQQVEELAGQLQSEVNTGREDEDGNGQPLAAKDGFRYDYDDASDLK